LLPSVAKQANVQSLTEWRTSPPSVARPDPREAVAEGDMNSWGWLKPGSAQPPYGDGRYYRFQVSFTPRATIRRDGGQLVFGRLAGRAEIWLDGALAVRKASEGVERVLVPLPAAAGNRMVTVLFYAPVGSPPFGIAGAVKVEPLG
jgi:beta-galactosidase